MRLPRLSGAGKAFFLRAGGLLRVGDAAEEEAGAAGAVLDGEEERAVDADFFGGRADGGAGRDGQDDGRGGGGFGAGFVDG